MSEILTLKAKEDVYTTRLVDLSDDSVEMIADAVAEKMRNKGERKIGKWIKKSKPLDFCTEWWYECSECGSKPPNDRYGHPNYLTDFCPNCGADMRGEENEETL